MSLFSSIICCYSKLCATNLSYRYCRIYIPLINSFS
nr:MAG TPA: hypothetical protein [Crassvirales sp.]